MLEALAAKGVTCLVTTHYERLKALGAGDPRFANASVGFDMERLEPTFRLHLGSPGSSGALAVARRMGIAVPVVERARELLGAAGTRVEELLASVADQRRRIEDERAALLAELEAAESDRAAMRTQREKTQARFEKATRAAHNEALSALQEEAHRWIGNAQENICALSIAVARQLLGQEVQADAAVVEALVRQALLEFPLDQAIVVRMHPADLAAITTLKSGMGASRPAPVNGERPEVQWLADQRVTRGGCVIEGRDRIIDGRIDTALERLYRRLSLTDA